jgi:hypothetical protein
LARHWAWDVPELFYVQVVLIVFLGCEYLPPSQWHPIRQCEFHCIKRVCMCNAVLLRMPNLIRHLNLQKRMCQ